MIPKLYWRFNIIVSKERKSFRHESENLTWNFKKSFLASAEAFADEKQKCKEKEKEKRMKQLLINYFL